MASALSCWLLPLLLLACTSARGENDGKHSSRSMSSVGASPECSGEIRLSVRPQAMQTHPDTGEQANAEYVVQRSAARPVFGVSYQLSDVSEDQPSLYKEFGATNPSARSAVSAIIRGLAPGKRYRLRVRYGQRSDGQTHWSAYGDAVETTSGEEQLEAGPAGVGGSFHTFCQSRRRRPGIVRPKQARVYQSTYTKASRRRRHAQLQYNSNTNGVNLQFDDFYDYSNDYTNYDYSTDCSYYDYCYDTGSPLGALIGGLIAGLFALAALGFVLCLRFCRRCNGGRYDRYIRINTSAVASSRSSLAPRPQGVTAMGRPVASQPLVAQPVANDIGGYVPPNESDVGLPPSYSQEDAHAASAAASGDGGTLADPAPAQLGGATPRPHTNAPMAGVSNPMMSSPAPAPVAVVSAPASGGVVPPAYTEMSNI